MAHIKKMTDKPRTLPWRAQVKRRGHPTQVKMFQTKAQAERWAHEQEKSILETGLPLTIKHLEKHTVADLVKRYLVEKTPQKGSHVSETATLKAFLKRRIAKLSLATVKKADAYAYIAERARDTWNGNPITPRTIARERNSIQHVFKIAKEEWGFENLKNPFEKISIKGSNFARNRRPEAAEIERISEASEKCRGLNRYYVSLAMYLAMETGLRLQEMFSLTWLDYKLQDRRIEIRKSKTDHKNAVAGRTIVTTPFADLMLARLKLQLISEGRFKSTDRIFPMTKGAFQQSWSDTVRRAKVKDLTFHDLRTEAGTRFDKAGLTKAEHNLMMGHGKRDITSIYISADLNSIQDKLDRFSLKGKTVAEMEQAILRNGLSEEDRVWTKAFMESAKRGLSKEQTQRAIELALRSNKQKQAGPARS